MPSEIGVDCMAAATIPAISSTPCGTPPPPARCRPQRVVRPGVPAELLYDVLTGGDESAPGPRALKLRGAHVVGPHDLEAATLRCPLRLERCELGEPITLDEASAPAIRFVACTLASLSADQLQTRGDLELAGSTATGALRLRGAHIGGQLSFAGATLTNDSGPALNADGLRVEQSMFCREGFSATGELGLRGAHIGGQLSFAGATLTNDSGPALNADGLRVEQDMFCDEGFSATGELVLLGAHIGGQLSFRGATLQGRDSEPDQADRPREPRFRAAAGAGGSSKR